MLSTWNDKNTKKSGIVKRIPPKYSSIRWLTYPITNVLLGKWNQELPYLKWSR